MVFRSRNLRWRAWIALLVVAAATCASAQARPRHLSRRERRAERARAAEMQAIMALPLRTTSEIGLKPAEPLPPPEPEEEKAASLGRVEAEPAPISQTSVLKILVGFVVLAALAYLGAHPAMRRLEHRLQITHVVTAGIPFIVLGVIASDLRIGILSEAVLKQIRPIITFGLGWIGFAVGFRFDVRLLNPMPRHMGVIAALLALLSAGVVSAVCVLAWTTASGSGINSAFVRDACIIGLAGAITAKSAPLLLQRRGADSGSVDRMSVLVHLEQLAGIIGLLLLAAYFRPETLTVTWQLPGTGWLFITLGVASVMAVVIYLVLGKAATGPQFYVVLLGSICLAAGMATFLRLSAVVVCFIVGAVLVNFPSTWNAQVGEALDSLERPVYFLFLVIAGALWREAGWQGWMLMLAFVVSRLAAKWLAVRILIRQKSDILTRPERRSLIFAPVGALSIAIVVNAQDLYSGPSIPAILTAVIGGAILTEIIIQFAMRSGYLDVEEAADASIRY